MCRANRYDSYCTPPAEAFAKAWVSMYSRIFVSLPFRTVMSKTQSSLNVLVVALIFTVATPTAKTRHPCAQSSLSAAITQSQTNYCCFLNTS